MTDHVAIRVCGLYTAPLPPSNEIRRRGQWRESWDITRATSPPPLQSKSSDYSSFTLFAPDTIRQSRVLVRELRLLPTSRLVIVEVIIRMGDHYRLLPLLIVLMSVVHRPSLVLLLMGPRRCRRPAAAVVRASADLAAQTYTSSVGCTCGHCSPPHYDRNR